MDIEVARKMLVREIIDTRQMQAEISVVQIQPEKNIINVHLLKESDLATVEEIIASLIPPDVPVIVTRDVPQKLSRKSKK